MALSIEDLLNTMILTEGGYVNRATDKGGATKYGITKPTLSRYLGRSVGDADIKNLEVQQAKAILKSLYYIAPRINLLPEALQPQLFDMCVNHGQGNAVGILQKVINACGWGMVEVDGAIGPHTAFCASACYQAMGGHMVNAIEQAREIFYNQIVAKDATQVEYIDGWIARAKRFLVEV